MSSDPLKHFKKAMDATVFQEINFSEKQKKKTLSFIEEDHEQKIDMYILKALQNSDKVGYDIYKHLQQTKANEYLFGEEGVLYVSLHELEKKGLIGSTWVEKEGQRKKYYYLKKKGKKQLTAWEKTIPVASPSLKLHLEWGRLE